MTLRQLYALRVKLESDISEAKEALDTLDPEIYGPHYRQKMMEAQQHLYQVNESIKKVFALDLARACLKKCWESTAPLNHPDSSEL